MIRLFLLLFLPSMIAGAEMPLDAKIYVAGHRGLVGSAIVRRLEKAGYSHILVRGHSDLDLRRQEEVERFFREEQPDFVFLAAAKVGGILANFESPASFIYDNLMIEANVVHAAYLSGVKKLLFLGSSCIYPRDCPQPIREEYLLAGPLEATNEPYAVAKIAGLKLCEAYNRQYGTKFISCMPTNLYGPGDHFDLRTSHVLPALIAKFENAKLEGSDRVEIWGTGSPRREFLHVDDLADAAFFLMNHYDGPLIVNIGCGEDLSIRELAELVREETGFTGELVFNSMLPDGTPRKLLDVSILSGLGWRPSIPLREGLRETIAWYRQMHLNGPLKHHL